MELRIFRPSLSAAVVPRALFADYPRASVVHSQFFPSSRCFFCRCDHCADFNFMSTQWKLTFFSASLFFAVSARARYKLFPRRAVFCYSFIFRLQNTQNKMVGITERSEARKAAAQKKAWGTWKFIPFRVFFRNFLVFSCSFFEARCSFPLRTAVSRDIRRDCGRLGGKKKKREARLINME